jgi:hypothetical protein
VVRVCSNPANGGWCSKCDKEARDCEKRDGAVKAAIEEAGRVSPLREGQAPGQPPLPSRGPEKVAERKASSPHPAAPQPPAAESVEPPPGSQQTNHSRCWTCNKKTGGFHDFRGWSLAAPPCLGRPQEHKQPVKWFVIIICAISGP